MRCEIELGDGPLDMKLVVKTPPAWRVPSDEVLTMFDAFFRDVQARLEAVPASEQLPVMRHGRLAAPAAPVTGGEAA